MSGAITRDQKILEEFIAKETTLLKEFTNDSSFLDFFTDTISDLKEKNTIIIVVTGGPGSGKSTFVRNIIAKLRRIGISADSVTTEDFNLHDRATRDKLIASGASPLDFKDFQHLNTLLEKIKQGQTVNAPLYDRTSGKAMDLENHSHVIQDHLDFLFVEGDFQPVKNPDFRIYFHVPTHVRRENRITRDLSKHALKTAKEVGESFDFRLESQYYPYTLPHHKHADIIVNISATESEKGEYRFTYSYNIHRKTVS